jgi:hypothetical protein
MQNKHLHNTKNVGMHHLCHIDKEISLGYDTIGEPISSTIRQILMDEVDVEWDPIFHSIEKTMRADTNIALLLETNNDLCMAILEDIEGWLAQKFKHSDDPTAYRDNEHVKVIVSKTEQRKSQQHVQFCAYAKRMIKKFCTFNPNEARDEFDYAPSPREKQWVSLSYAAVVTTPV